VAGGRISTDEGAVVRISDLIEASEMGRLTALSKQMRQIAAPPSYLGEWAESQRRLRELTMPRSAFADMAATLDHSHFRLSDSVKGLSGMGSRIAEMLGPTATERLALTGIAGTQMDARMKLAAALPNLSDQQLRVAGALGPMMEAQKRMDEAMGSQIFSLQKAVAGIPTSSFSLPPSLFQRLDAIAAGPFLGTFQEPEYLRALRSLTEAVSAAALGFPDSVAEAFADLLEGEFEEATALVAADPAALEGMTVLDLLLVLQNAWGALREHPVVRAAVLMIVGALVQGGVQQVLSASDHTEMMEELRRQSALLEQGRAEGSEHNGNSGSEDEVRGEAIGNAHVRVGPDVKSKSLGKLSKGDIVLILGREGDWLRVLAGLPGGAFHSGWVYARLVKAVL
jgi:hypothetical protein